MMRNRTVVRRASSPASCDRALRARELGEDVVAPAQDEEFVISHSDNVQATGFVEHLKLPHYVDFQAELDLVRRMRREYAERLERRVGAQEVLDWWDADPATWIAESTALRDEIYPSTGGEAGMGTFEAPAILRYRYHWEWVGPVEQRLAQSGVRLAAFLDQVFADDAADTSAQAGS